MTHGTTAIEDIVIRELDALGFDLVEIRRGGSKSRPVLEVRIDRRDGASVAIDDCARASRALEAQLEGNGLVDERYVLEVSSPGADRPLNTIADWRRFAGQTAIVTCALLAGGKEEVGILSVEGDPGAEFVRVKNSKGVEVQLPLSAVTQARLAFHWKR